MKTTKSNLSEQLDIIKKALQTVPAVIPFLGNKETKANNKGKTIVDYNSLHGYEGDFSEIELSDDDDEDRG